MKLLDIPYIGMKLESLSTILRVLSESKSDEDFIHYFASIGKARKTATEYLASLRNLKLAKKDNQGNTILISSGENLLKDNINSLYKNLLKHCLNNFPDLKIVWEVAQKMQTVNLAQLIANLEKKGFSIKRKQTLSSFLKLFYESERMVSKRIQNPTVRNINENFEFNQFKKMLSKYFIDHIEKKIEIPDLYNYINSKFKLSKERFIEHLTVLKQDPQVKFYEINLKIINDSSRIFLINGKAYYYLELI